jgi:hypothetical protein
VTLAHSTWIEALGWASTAVFAGSYLCARERTLVRAQMVGALMWTGYGVLVRAPPVVAANLLVLAAAAWKSRRRAPLTPVPADSRPTTSTGSAPPLEDGLRSATHR